MSHPGILEVIVIDDSDPDDYPKSGANSVLIDDDDVASTVRAQGSPEPVSWYNGLGRHVETQIRQRLNRNPSQEVIEVDSDELSVTERPPSKRARTDGYGTLDQGLDHGNRRTDIHTTPMVVHGSAVEESHVVRARPGRMRKDFIWVTARRIVQTQQRYGKGMLPAGKQSRLRVNPLLALELSPVTASLWMAAGAINKVIQRPGCIAISSAASGGQPNDLEYTVQLQDYYNREATLQLWQDGISKDRSIILHGHCVIESPSQSERLEPTCLKCYTVNDITFDPNQSHLMASTGNNGSVQLWQGGEKVENGCYKYPRAPHDVVYRERDSLLAVTCLNGSVYIHHPQEHHPLGDPVELRVAPQEAQHSVGAVVWGKGASADTLFASSEPQSMTDYTGYHVAFDPDQGRRAYEFNAKESGDAMALDPDGERLALCTTARDESHALRLYDVRRKNGRHPVNEIHLNPFYVAPGSSQLEPHEGEVKAVSFSPDGLLLAVARNDDELHIYDSRFLRRNRVPMRRFLHWGEDRCMGGDRWGIVDAIWIDGWCGRGLGVVTGGSDGCVRFWDVRRSDDDISNGEVLAQPNSDIGHFSVGDPYRGEKPLVVGDNGGRVYVYDHASACGFTR